MILAYLNFFIKNNAGKKTINEKIKDSNIEINIFEFFTSNKSLKYIDIIKDWHLQINNMIIIWYALMLTCFS